MSWPVSFLSLCGCQALSHTSLLSHPQSHRSPGDGSAEWAKPCVTPPPLIHALSLSLSSSFFLSLSSSLFLSLSFFLSFSLSLSLDLSICLCTSLFYLTFSLSVFLPFHLSFQKET